MLSLLSLVCAALLFSDASTSSNKLKESKRKCFIHWAGNFSGFDLSTVPIYFNVTGSKKTTIEIPDRCPSWPVTLGDTKLVLEEITVCNEDGFILEVTPPEKGDLSRMEVRCFVKILGIRIPCILRKYNMEVTVNQYCAPQIWQKQRQK